MESFLSRILLASSGFVVFLVTASLYGAQGRGVISYGNALFALFAHSLSFNIGRSYLTSLGKKHDEGLEQLKVAIRLNFLLTALAIFSGLGFWLFSSSAKEILSPMAVILFSMTTLSHIWIANGSFFYSASGNYKLQDRTILLSRSVLILLSAVFYILSKAEHISLTKFVFLYCVSIMCISVWEVFKLTSTIKFNFSIPSGELYRFKSLIKSSFLTHIENMTIQVFPLLVTIIAGKLIHLKDIGIFNFLIQVLGILFLGANIAGVRVVDSLITKTNKKNNLYDTIIKVSAVQVGIFVLILCLFYFDFFKKINDDFSDLTELFLLSSIAVVGYTLYTIVNPLVLFRNLVFFSATNNMIIFILSSISAFYLIQLYYLNGLVIAYVLFFSLIGLSQLVCLLKMRKA